MNNQIKITVIIAIAVVVAIVGATSLVIYFSPYQSCVRVIDHTELPAGSSFRTHAEMVRNAQVACGIGR